MGKTLYFDREKFAKAYREQFGPLTQQQTNGLTFILDAVEKDPYIERVEWLAYMLATTKLETAHTFQPIHEYGGRAYFIRRYGSHTKVGKNLGNDTQEEGAIYAGRGDVQLTGEDNYERAEVALRKFYPELVADFERRTGKVFDLTVGDQPGDDRDPDNAQDPAIAYAIMSYGMRTGMFTGKKLPDYINAQKKDYKNARRIINGLDHWQLIKTAAEKFEIILKASKSSAAGSPDKATITPDEQAATDTTSIVGGDTPSSSQDQPPIVQNAEQIINTGDQSNTPAPEDKTLVAPTKDGATSTATKTTVLGIAVPPTLYAIFSGISDWVEKGYIDAKEIGTTLLGLLRDNYKYVFILIGLIIVILIVKKIVKQVTFWIQMITAAVPQWNTIKVVPTVTETPSKWWQIWK